MKKLLMLNLILIIAALLGSLYGIVHDQITYTISPEYYTKFKFYQFGLMDRGHEAIFPNPRVEVSLVGIMATWWMGGLIGLVLGLAGLIHKNAKAMFQITMKAFLITISVTFLTGLIGLLYGKYYLFNAGVDWWLPDNLADKKNFIAVGSMHNFSYLGGLLGMLAGIIFSFKSKRKQALNSL